MQFGKDQRGENVQKMSSGNLNSVILHVYNLV